MAEVVNTDVEERLKALNINLPDVPANPHPFAPGVVSGNTVILSGQTPKVDGRQQYVGIVGESISMEEAQEAARTCTLNLLASLKYLVGDLNRVKRVIKVNGYVAATPQFKEHPVVINAVSNMLYDVFGKEHQHARIAVGLASLPGGAPVEVEMTVEIN
ncbi:RidA family protein [Bacillus thermotolerans]|uniref:RidA family protein n=1 Tax=Bacillus thermotolerans TaxID=1221996 RepID=UPI000580042F|nr:RidA family protein [Bacillus thermotolerans]KKB36629.1 hypothetical protein QY97_00801 [Bacillus thermotolerans]